MLELVNALDISYFGDEKPADYLFFKGIGVSILKNENSQRPNLNNNYLGLNIRTSGGLKKLIVIPSTIEKTGLADIGIPANGFLYFRYLPIEDIQQIKIQMDRDPQFRIYFICHTFFCLNYEYEKLKSVGLDLSRISFLIVRAGENSDMHSINTVRNFCPDSKYNEFLHLNTYVGPENKKQAGENRINLFFLFKLFQLIVSPVYSLKIYFEKLRTNQFIWIRRLHELGHFLAHLIKIFLFKYVLDGVNFIKGALKIIGVRLFYLVRHILLMCGFKSFGMIVDSYYKTRSVGDRMHNGIKITSVRIFYFLRHIILMGFFKSYGTSVDLINSVLGKSWKFREALRSAGWLIRGFINGIAWRTKVLLIRLYYRIRHIVLVNRHLISLNGLIGISRVVFYPLFKIYWFLSYQYKKRIKKIL